MGCTNARENIEDKMMLLKLKRIRIRMERDRLLKRLKKIDGHEIEIKEVPDYLAHPEITTSRIQKNEPNNNINNENSQKLLNLDEGKNKNDVQIPSTQEINTPSKKKKKKRKKSVEKGNDILNIDKLLLEDNTQIIGNDKSNQQPFIQ